MRAMTAPPTASPRVVAAKHRLAVGAAAPPPPAACCCCCCAAAAGICWRAIDGRGASRSRPRRSLFMSAAHTTQSVAPPRGQSPWACWRRALGMKGGPLKFARDAQRHLREVQQEHAERGSITCEHQVNFGGARRPCEGGLRELFGWEGRQGGGHRQAAASRSRRRSISDSLGVAIARSRQSPISADAHQSTMDGHLASDGDERGRRNNRRASWARISTTWRSDVITAITTTA